MAFFSHQGRLIDRAKPVQRRTDTCWEGVAGYAALERAVPPKEPAMLESRPNPGRSASAAALLGIAPPNRYHHALI